MAELDAKKLGQPIVKGLSEAVARAIAHIGARVLQKVAENTPVDTGRCQSNWQLSDSRTNARYLSTPTLRPQYGDTRGPTFQKVVREAKVEAERLSRDSKLVKGSDVSSIYILNPTPYLRDLDRGKSRQARAGWIKRASRKEFNRQKRDFSRFVGDALRGLGG